MNTTETILKCVAIAIFPPLVIIWISFVHSLKNRHSAKWRNRQLLRGKAVYRPGELEYYKLEGNRVIGRFIDSDEFNSSWNCGTFMRNDSGGWKLYRGEK